MVQIPLNGPKRVVDTCREVLQAAQAGGDEFSAALISDRMRIHEKAAWMLRALR
jgi:starvation-inducible DNA-binding protein